MEHSTSSFAIVSRILLSKLPLASIGRPYIHQAYVCKFLQDHQTTRSAKRGQIAEVQPHSLLRPWRVAWQATLRTCALLAMRLMTTDEQDSPDGRAHLARDHTPRTTVR